MSKIESDYELHDSTGHWIARVFATMRREFDKELRSHGVSISEWAVLAGLHSGKASTPSQLAELAGLDRAVVTRALDRLVEERGFATRESNDEDRRSITVELTAAGERLASTLLEANRRINDEFLRGVSAREKSQFRRTLRHILENAPDPDERG